MLKEQEPPKEPARIKASRKWVNADIIKEIKTERTKPKLVDHNAPPKIGDVLVQDKPKGPVKNLERRFIRDIRAMMADHAKLNLQIYAIRLEHRRRILLREKLRRLKLAQQNNGE